MNKGYDHARLVPLLALVCLALGIGLAASPLRAAVPPQTELAPLWDSAMKALHESSHQEAARLLAAWIDEGEKQGIRSAEAHYNLGLAEWGAKRPGKAVYHLVESARLRSSPLSALKAISTLGGLQKELGIRDGVSEAASFRLYFLLNPDWILAFVSLSFWLVALTLVVWWLKGRAIYRVQATCLSVAAAFTTIAVIGIVNRAYFCNFGVLDGDREMIPLYKKPIATTPDEADKLVDLPAGTLVKLAPSPEREGYAPISRPVAGWVPSATVRKFGDR